MSRPRLGIVILAAGEARRFGSCKQLALFQGKPLLQHVIEEAMSLEHERLIVVTGKYHVEIDAARDSGVIDQVELVNNPNWSVGMSSSIALATSILLDNCDQLLLLLADQILITRNELTDLLKNAPDDGMCCAGFNGTVGPPVVFSATHFSALKRLDHREGAKHMLQDPTNHVVVYPMKSAAWDIDTTQDLEQLLDVSGYIFAN